jgi:TM2 domain-containing membrane protein YozV
VQAYSNAPQPPVNYQYQPQVGVAGTPQRDPTIALLLEFLGYIGFLGIGHIYAGRVTRGIVLLVGWWIYWAVTFVLFIVLIGFCFALLGLAGPIASGLWIRNEMEKENALARQRYG